MDLLIYDNKVITSECKRGSRTLTQKTLFKNKICYSSECNMDDLFGIFSNKRLFIINRNPISHISSGLWNVLEYQLKQDGSTFKSWCNEYLQYYSGLNYSLLHRFMYITADTSKPHIHNGNATIIETISQQELLEILNLHIRFYNKHYVDIEKLLKEDPHIYPNQLLVKKFVEEFKFELVDIEEHNNLLEHLGFNISDAQNKKFKYITSQAATTPLYTMLLNYILTQDIQTIVDGFKQIYGRCSVIRNSSLEKILKYEPTIEHINNEVKIYQELKEKYDTSKEGR